MLCINNSSIQFLRIGVKKMIIYDLVHINHENNFKAISEDHLKKCIYKSFLESYFQLMEKLHDFFIILNYLSFPSYKSDIVQ